MIKQIDKELYDSKVKDYHRIDKIINKIYDHFESIDLKPDSNYCDTYGYFSVYPAYRERKRYMDLAELLVNKKEDKIDNEG